MEESIGKQGTRGFQHGFGCFCTERRRWLTTSHRHTRANKAREMKSRKDHGGIEDFSLWRTTGRPRVPFHDQQPGCTRGARASTAEVRSGGDVEVTCGHGQMTRNRTAGSVARPVCRLLLVMVDDGVFLRPVKVLVWRVGERNMLADYHQL